MPELPFNPALSHKLLKASGFQSEHIGHFGACYDCDILLNLDFLHLLAFQNENETENQKLKKRSKTALRGTRGREGVGVKEPEAHPLPALGRSLRRDRDPFVLYSHAHGIADEVHKRD